MEFFATKIVIIYFQISSNVPMPFGTSKGQKGLPLFVLVIFFVKNFQLHCKGCKHFPS
jgi:hypothetical protein